MYISYLEIASKNGRIDSSPSNQLIGIVDFSKFGLSDFRTDNSRQKLPSGVFYNFGAMEKPIPIAVFSKPARDSQDFSEENSYVFVGHQSSIKVRLEFH